MRFIGNNNTGENALEAAILSAKLSNGVDTKIWIIGDTLLGEHRIRASSHRKLYLGPVARRSAGRWWGDPCRLKG